jgi:hypothetical protein
MAGRGVHEIRIYPLPDRRIYLNFVCRWPLFAGFSQIDAVRFKISETQYPQ